MRQTMSIAHVLRRVRCAAPLALALSSLKAQTPADTAKINPQAQVTQSAKLQAFEERRAKGHGYYVTDEELRKNDNRMLSNVIKRIPGTRIVSSGMSEYLSAAQTMSVGRMGAPGQARYCYVAVYEDAVPLYTGSQQVPDFARMPVKDYVAVEFYRGSASIPTELSTVRPSDCGVLLLWTRER